MGHEPLEFGTRFSPKVATVKGGRMGLLKKPQSSKVIVMSMIFS